MRLTIETPDDQFEAIERLLQTVPHTIVLRKDLKASGEDDRAIEKETKATILSKRNPAVEKYLEQLTAEERTQLAEDLRRHEQRLAFKADLEEAFAEVDKMERGEIPATSLKDFLDEL